MGRDVDSIGINPLADILELGGQKFGVIGVQTVQSGSLADDAGIKPGDLLIEMESKLLAQSGTMREFCLMVRSCAVPTVKKQSVALDLLRTITT